MPRCTKFDLHQTLVAAGGIEASTRATFRRSVKERDQPKEHKATSAAITQPGPLAVAAPSVIDPSIRLRGRLFLTAILRWDRRGVDRGAEGCQQGKLLRWQRTAVG